MLVTACAALSLAYAFPLSKVAVLDEGDAPAPNRTEALVQWADKCMQVVPAGLNMKDDCVNLAIAGAGSRTIYDLAKKAGWKRAVHQHSDTVLKMLAKTPAPRCFVVELREPAARLESWYKDNVKGAETGEPIDKIFEKNVLGAGSVYFAEKRSFPVTWYFRNSSGVEGAVIKGSKNGTRMINTQVTYLIALLWGAAMWYNEHSEETQVPGIDTTSVYIDEDKGAPAMTNSPLIDCVEKQIVIGFLCEETLAPSFEAFVNSTTDGKPLNPPAGLQVGMNPDIDDSKYPGPLEKFKLSDKNRQVWNNVFMYDDMALYRHFCLGNVDESLVQQNEEAGGFGTQHGKFKPGV